YDNDGDGTFDNSAIREFDDKGNIIKYTKDTGLTISYVRDDKGYSTTESVDHNGDGKPDLIYTSREYDKGGRLTNFDVDSNGDGVVDSSQIREYDAKGASTKLSIDKGNDGTIDQVNTYENNDFGLVTKINYDTNNDGNLDRIDTRTYSEHGIWETTSVDLKADSSIDFFQSYMNMELPSDDSFIGISSVYLVENNIALTIPEATLDKIASDKNSHKLVINSSKEGDQLHLDGNFTKTAETESHSGQDYVKYTDEAGNALIVDPDITVDII
ncbi:hypothetical protein, partial [Pasteurella atlantica]|uniref:hypothetical protein n=1 Tax=Pasteurellaceae TaxID=712 RepID=UPI00275107A8